MHAAIRPYIGNKQFYRKALAVMIPVIIQQLINTMFNVVDNVMVGGLGPIAMTAVTTANKPYLIYNGMFFGMTGAAGLMLSQYYGAGDDDTCQGLFALEMLLGFLIAGIYGLLLFALPGPLMRIFVTDTATVAMGIDYMRTVSLSYIPAAISSVCIFSMRSLGKNTRPMIISMISMVANAVLNYLLIYGFGMGVKGAALGTVIARTIEAALYVLILLQRKSFFSFNLSAVRRLTAPVIRAFALRAIPLTINEIFFALGFNVYFWAYARIDEALLPAITVMELTQQVSFVIATGMSSAVSVMIGTALGAGHLDEARSDCKKLFALDTFIGLICTLIGMAGSTVLPLAFDIGDALRATATQLTLLSCIFYVPNAVYGFCFFCLRAGGDTKWATLMDSGFMWVLPVPLSLVLGFFFPGRISLPMALLLVNFTASLKIIPSLLLLKRGHWVRNITLRQE
ncbi:MAG: MATE family efflux transporter [Clostridia bacterium]|nr:MATE family efflux transporter [Clostridia bacterium]